MGFLTGQPQFRGDSTAEALLMVMTQEPTPPSRIKSRIPRDLETICLKCLAKVPGKRYSSADDLAKDLARFQENRPIIARPAGRFERASRWCGNPVVAALSTLAGAFVLVAILLLFQERARTLANLDRAENAERDLIGLTAIAPSNSGIPIATSLMHGGFADKWVSASKA